jgi:hypothetical protein
MYNQAVTFARPFQSGLELRARRVFSARVVFENLIDLDAFKLAGCVLVKRTYTLISYSHGVSPFWWFVAGELVNSQNATVARAMMKQTEPHPGCLVTKSPIPAKVKMVAITDPSLAGYIRPASGCLTERYSEIIFRCIRPRSARRSHIFDPASPA